MNELENEAHLLVGFDYSTAVQELLTKFTYSEITDALGYSSVGSINAIIKGKVPSHLHGEAMWVLYRKTFGRRPPLTDAQKKANNLTDGNPVAHKPYPSAPE